METELIRFRIDPQLAQQAEQVCAAAGFELRDVLRFLVTRIARTGVIASDLADAGASEARQRPFYDYDERLWADLKPSIDAEVALALLARFVADCSTRLDEAEQGEPVDRRIINELAQARDEARVLKRGLDVTDAAAVQRILERFGPLVRSNAP